MKKIIFTLIITMLFISNANAETYTKEAIFVRCVDGDTAVLKVENEELKFRFLAIDTPETVHPTKEVEAFGKNASEYTCNKLTNAKSIEVEYEKSNEKDKYGRSLAWIWVDKSLLQKELVEVGYADVAYIYGDYRYTEGLCQVENSAKDKKVGVWEDENHKQKYCSTIKVDDKKDDINYQNVDKETSEIANTVDKVSNTLENGLNVLSKVDTRIVAFIVLIGALVIVVLKEMKKK